MIRAWSASRCWNLSPAFVAREGLGNTGVVVIEGDGSTWTALSWQDASLGPEAVDSDDDGPAAEPLDPSEING
jgi:probable phosphoglycerate mutase